MKAMLPFRGSAGRVLPVQPIRARIGAALAALAAMAAAAPVSAQELFWNPGHYDYTGHMNKTPGEVDLPLGTPPGFDAGIAHPASLAVKVSGMAFLSDGRMALAHWGGFGKLGSIYLLEGMGGNPQTIKSTVIAKDI